MNVGGGEMEERIRAIVEGDRLFHLFHMELLAAGEGCARLRAQVKNEFLNAHNIAHGGLIFALLDVAFAVATNALVDTIGIQWSFNVFRSAARGDFVRAEARVIHQGKRSLVVELKAESESTHKLLAQGMATALPLPRQKNL
jgi:acyl-CoA thioesterase